MMERHEMCKFVQVKKNFPCDLFSFWNIKKKSINGFKRRYIYICVFKVIEKEQKRMNVNY
jgi:hypothetical protein